MAEGTFSPYDFSGYVENLWPDASELLLPPLLRSSDSDAGANAFDFAPFDAPTDDEFVRLLLGGGRCAVAARAPAGHMLCSSPEPPAAPPAPPRRVETKPHTPEKACEPRGQKSDRRYWSPDERARFHDAMRRHGADFSEISKAVGTRTSTQVRTHVQKYHLKLVRDYTASKKAAAAARESGKAVEVEDQDAQARKRAKTD